LQHQIFLSFKFFHQLLCIVIAIVRSDHRCAFPWRGAVRRGSGGAERRATARHPSCLTKAPPTANVMIQWAGLYLERLERFYRRALISTISKINISIIIANIAKRYGTFMFISIPSTFLCAVSEFSRRTLYIYIYILGESPIVSQMK